MDAVKLVIVFLLFLGVPFGIAKMWWWLGFWVGLAIYLALYELVCKLVTGHTISKRFWLRKITLPKWLLWAIGTGLVCFWSYFICHLYLGW